MRGVSGVALAVVMPLVGFGQQPGWVQDVPWIQTASVDVHSWSAGETFALQQQTLLPEFGAVAMGFTQMVGRGWPRLSVPIGRPHWKSATIC